jgi:hypothetical protein
MQRLKEKQKTATLCEVPPFFDVKKGLALNPVRVTGQTHLFTYLNGAAAARDMCVVLLSRQNCWAQMMLPMRHFLWHS